MELLKDPMLFNELVDSLNLNDKIYEAMSKDDFTEVILCLLESYEETVMLPPLELVRKSATESNVLRNHGNTAFKERNYLLAQEFYNKALLMAPKHSEALVLAYSNRSALSYQIGCYKACLSDINTCFKMNCPQRIVEKLNKRREKAEPRSVREKFLIELRHKMALKDISLKNKNADIPCASADIGAKVDDFKLPKLIATNFVNVGKILAVEKAFVSIVDPSELSTACYYCHKKELNLTPCDNCTVVLFCNETCKTACVNEYHNIECKIMEVVSELQPHIIIALKAAIKMKNQIKSWDKLLKESLDVGVNRIKHSKINEIYDGENILSMLNFKDDDVFIYGQFHNIINEVSLIIYYLDQTKSFFPLNRDENQAAISGFSRLLIYFSLHIRITSLSPHVTSLLTKKTCTQANESLGVFALLNKIKHSCNPNALVVSLNNKAMLVAVQPIEAGTELTISCLGHRQEMDSMIDSKKWKEMLFSAIKTVCKNDCTVCNVLQSETILEEKHKRVARQLLDIDVDYLDADRFREGYARCSQALSILSDVPHSEEYRTVFSLFRRHLLFIQEGYSVNFSLNPFI